MFDLIHNSDGFGNVFFNDCLFACMKKAYGVDSVNDGAIELKRFLIRQEYETKKKIEDKKRQMLIKQKLKIFNNMTNSHVNPIVLMLFCGMAFKSWRNYLHKIKSENGEYDKVLSFPTSSSSSSSSCSPSQSESEDDEDKYSESQRSQLEDIDENSVEDDMEEI